MKHICVLFTVTLLASCATNSNNFESKKTKISNANLCRLFNKNQSNLEFTRNIQIELDRRNLNSTKCYQEIYQQDVNNEAAAEKAVVALAVIAVVGAVAYGAQQGAYYNPQPTYQVDFQWEWDEFYDEYRRLVWQCRGVQSGQFATVDHCQYKAQVDWKWPSK